MEVCTLIAGHVINIFNYYTNQDSAQHRYTIRFGLSYVLRSTYNATTLEVFTANSTIIIC
jgi:hypothetical protein